VLEEGCLASIAIVADLHHSTPSPILIPFGRLAELVNVNVGPGTQGLKEDPRRWGEWRAGHGFEHIDSV
jgi:hypothetical protein